MSDTILISLLDWRIGDEPIEYPNISNYGEDESTFFFVYKGRTCIFNKNAVLAWSVG